MDVPPLCSNISISNTLLISTLHQTFSQSQHRSLRIDTASIIALSPNIDDAFVSDIWEHARRRAEDQALLVVATHRASSTAFFSAVSAFPNVQPCVLQALNALTPFLTALTPENISTPFHNGVSVAFSLNSEGLIVSSRLALSNEPLISLDQLLRCPSKSENRVFDAFYYMLLSEKSHGEYLSFKSSLDQYELLRKSGTYKLPDWVQISDDDALAQDWCDSLRHCGIKGESFRSIMATLSGILLLGNSSSPNDIAEGASLIGIKTNTIKKYSTDEIIASVYKLLIKKVVEDLNKYLATFDLSEQDENEIISVVNIVECAPTIKSILLSNVFDNSAGINSEVVNDGIQMPKTPKNVSSGIKKITSNEKPPVVKSISDFQSLVNPSINPLATLSAPVTSDDEETPGIFEIRDLVDTSRIWTILNASPFANAKELSKDQWSGPVVSAQVREYFVKDWAEKRRGVDFTVDFEHYEFVSQYSSILPPNAGIFMLEDWARNDQNWGPEDFSCGHHRLWLSEKVWNQLEGGLGRPLRGSPDNTTGHMVEDPYAYSTFDSASINMAPPSIAPPLPMPGFDTSAQSIVSARQSSSSPQKKEIPQYGKNPFSDVADLQEPLLLDDGSNETDEEDPFEDDFLLQKFDKEDIEQNATRNKDVKVEPVSIDRRAWVFFVWLMTFWIPSPILKYIVRMKRPDVRMAWREKIVIFFIIFLINCAIIFYMIFLGKIICPDYAKVWNSKQVHTHQGTNDYYVSIHGKVYDMTKFYRLQHSDNGMKTTSDLMMNFAGLDLSDYFPPPLVVACPGLVKDVKVSLDYNTTLSAFGALGSHQSGAYYVRQTTTKLHNYTWYNDVLQPKLKKFYKGKLVAKRGDLISQSQNNNKFYFTIDKQIYDVTNYFLTTSNHPESDGSSNNYTFFDSGMSDLFQQAQGTDITDKFYGNEFDDGTRANTLTCLNNAFYAGELDFRDSMKCQAANYILLVIAAILTSVTVVKFLASIRFGGKARPAPQDKFVICQIPAYTEGEDELRVSIDSLTNLQYDNRRKLLMIICDGMIVGSGNDRPTARIVLDLLGVSDKIDPPALPYHSVGEESNMVNFAKVYSGLYENEGNVVPFIVVAKCGRPDEREKPGNRGKRDSQIIMLDFLNRVHYQKSMSPLQLELFHHINNVIGVDPEMYEYLFMVDADTSVAPDALNRLVAACTNDAKVAGTCGETALQNEEQSWSTMVQVYEYFISHHLTKAFESLFGSVTCLPGCFSLYRLRTTKKFKPLIISNEIIRDYSVNHVDTLHKKNLFSLGEDRYLTTLMSKYFPKMKLSFVADAKCMTIAPDKFSVLLSQRRRWINSTIHNLVELLYLNNMCGFCCFGMRGVVFIDLAGTIMLPSVAVYLGYLIYVIASKTSPLPLISIILIAAVYGLQMLVFILHRQWQHIGWMLIYLIAYPIHSFLLPIYSFWNMDNFTWGNTRMVLEEKGDKQAVIVEPLKIDPRSIQMETWKAYAMRNGLPGVERRIVYDDKKGRLQYEITDEGYDLQDLTHLRKMESFYSRPMSTFTGLEVPGQRTSTIGSDLSRPTSQMFGSKSRQSIFTSGMSTMEFDPSTESQLRDTIRSVLHNADLDNTTKRQLRVKVEDIMGVEYVGDRIRMLDDLIDEELAEMDLDEEEDDESLKGEKVVEREVEDEGHFIDEKDSVRRRNSG